MKTSRIVIALITTFAVLALGSCGGGGGGGGTPPPPPPQTLAIVTPSIIVDGMVNEAYSLQLSSRGGTGAVHWSINYGSADWASIESGTGRISGTPTSAGSFFMYVHAQDSATTPQTADIYVDVFISSQMHMSASPTEAIRAYPYSWTGEVTGGKPPFTASVASGTMPAGLTLSTFGNWISFTGKPADAGDFSFTLRIRDSASTQQTLDQPFTLPVKSILKITSSELKYGVVGRGYSDTVQSVNGTAPLTWAITSAGSEFAIDGNGTLSATPTTAGSRSVMVKVTDSSTPQQSDEKWVSLNVYDVLSVSSPMTTITRHLDDWVSSYVYNSGGVPPVNVEVASGNIPPGLHFGGGMLSGYANATGTWNFGLRFEDSATPPQTYDHPVTVTILPPLPQILSDPPTPLVGEEYSFQMGAAKGTSPYKWDITDGVLPGGMSLSQSGLLSGTPAAGGVYGATFRVTDSATPAQSAEKWVVFQLLPKPMGRNDSPATATPVRTWSPVTASLSPYDDPPGTVAPDTDYYKFYANSGSEVTVSVAANVYPPDPVLEIVDGNGVRFTTCKDPADDNPVAPIVRDATPEAFDDDCVNDDIDIGMNRNSRLVFKVPGEAGKLTTFYAHVLELEGLARPDLAYYMNINGAIEPLLINTSSDIPLVKGRAVNVQLTTSGGSSPVSWTLVSGSLPAGLSLSSAGVLSGTPTTVGTATFTVTASDSSSPPMTASETLGATVADPLSITTTSLPSGQTGVPYNGQLAWSGGMAPFTIYQSGLPPGLSIDRKTGSITGKPTTAGSYSVSFSLNDYWYEQATKTLSLSVGSGPLYVATATLPNATKDVIYSAMVTGAGGKQPYAWQITSGALPPGMALNASTGEVRGIPTSSGVYSFTVKVTDANAATATATLQLTVQ